MSLMRAAAEDGSGVCAEATAGASTITTKKSERTRITASPGPNPSPESQSRNTRIPSPDSKDLVENAHEDPRGEVVLDQAAPEITDAHLPDRRRRHHVPRPDVRRADDAGEDEDLAVAVDLDFA